jgi:hypothetical protein
LKNNNNKVTLKPGVYNFEKNNLKQVL